MTTTNSRGIVFLEESDPISPFHTLINVLQQGTSDAINGILQAVTHSDNPVPEIKMRLGTTTITTNAGSNVIWDLTSQFASIYYVGLVRLSGAPISYMIADGNIDNYALRIYDATGTPLPNTTLNVQLLFLGR